MLIEACIAGNDAAWHELVHRYSRLVYSVPRRYGLDRDVCEDLYQEVFSILVRQLPGIKSRSGLPKWLITTAHRVCRQWLKRSRRVPGVLPDVVEQAAPPTELVLELERRQLVRQALRRLGGRCEELLTALYTNQGTAGYDEVATKMNLPIGSIGPMRARCLQKLLRLVERMERDLSA